VTVGQPAAEGWRERFDQGKVRNSKRVPDSEPSNAPSALERIRSSSSKDKEIRFTALFHHIYAPEALRTAYLCLKREAAVRRGRRDVAALRRGALRITSRTFP